ncbi:MAG TPA: hypothetical protein VMT18_12105 [Planctomycetota bacterium]|nr:hypothetical protein [Planctomycetota bacterium]
MQAIRLVAIDPDFDVQAVEERRASDAAREAAIAAHWLAAGAASASPLRDGPVLCLVEADRRRLVARLLRRREVLAGRRDPTLTGGRAPEPVAVASLVSSHGRLLLGHRRDAPPAGAGSWELVASEDLDDAFLERGTRRVDYRGALLVRLVECAPLARPPRERLVPFALAHDAEAGRWQLCLALELAPGAQSCADIERAVTPAYDAFRFVRPVDVIESAPDGAEELAPLSAALMRVPRAGVSVA